MLSASCAEQERKIEDIVERPFCSTRYEPISLYLSIYIELIMTPRLYSCFVFSKPSGSDVAARRSVHCLGVIFERLGYNRDASLDMPVNFDAHNELSLRFFCYLIMTIHPPVPIRMSCTALIFLTRPTFRELCISLLPYLCTAQKHNGVVSIYLRISFRPNLELGPVSLMFLQQEKFHVRVSLG